MLTKVLKESKMTKRIIDADALLECVQSLAHGMYCEDMIRDYTVVVVDELINKINELATSAPAPQESVDADGWLDIKTAPYCKMLIVYDSENKLSAVATYRPAYSNDPNKNWRDAWDYSKGINFIPTHYRLPLPTIPTGGNHD